MRRFTSLFAPFLACFLCGCASYALNELAPIEHSAQIQDFELVQEHIDAFLTLPDAVTRLEAMRGYAIEAAMLFKTESFRVAPLGTALVTNFDASLAGHLALSKIYTTLEPDAALTHAAWVERLKNHATFGRDGSLQKPYRAFTLADAHAFTVERGQTVIGSMYGEADPYPMVAYVISRNDEGHISKVYFEIMAFERWRDLTADPQNAIAGDVIREMAKKGDNSAQVAYGLNLIELAAKHEGRGDDLVATGKQWLRRASSSENALPPYLLANYEVAQRSDGISWERVKQRYERAMKLGLTDANYQLARLYIEGVFGQNAQAQGVTLLQQAAEKNDINSATTLGRIFLRDDPERALGYFRQAAELGKEQQRLRYIRNIARARESHRLAPNEFQWALDLAETGNQEALLLLGTVYARGLFEDEINLRKARKWYRKSVQVEPSNGLTVNEISWILATTNIKRLRDPSLAIKYMDNLMAINDEARGSAQFVDTWAAAYASAGDFQRAIELMEEAVELASRSQEDYEYLLRAHLKHYQDKKAIIEEVP